MRHVTTPPPLSTTRRENRSFDHLLGHLKAQDPRIDGLDGSQGNWVGKTFYPVNYNAVDGGPVDPCHSFDCETIQIYGYEKPVGNKTAPSPMSGFGINTPGGVHNVPFVMSAFNSSDLPILSTLALEFAVFDHWHSSVPSCTNPNREFLLSASSNGYLDNSFPAAGFPQKTHFRHLTERNISWNIIYNDDPWMAPAFADLRTPAALANVLTMEHFYWQLGNGTLPAYTYIQPRMATSAAGVSSWQHPDNSVSAGEQLISDVYTALRASSAWEESLLIITYDEHGGFADHVSPPGSSTPGVVPAPDATLASNGFDFTRLGVRIPTVAVSPLIPRNTVVSAPTPAQAPQATSWWDATSIISTANRLLGADDAHLTARDAWAAHFEDILSLPAPRDTPATLPPVAHPLSAEGIAAEMAMHLNEHHLDSLNLLCGLARGGHPVCQAFAGSRAAYLAGELAAWAPARSWEYTPEQYPHLHFPAAQRLRQQHFGDISARLYARFKKAAGAA